MILKEPLFAAMRINWNDKVQNMRELAEELRIGLDSMVFLDDDPTNRAAMRTFIPEVETPELPKNPAEYAKFLISLPYFPAQALTDEDKMRGNLYVTERLRMESEKAYVSRDEFLKSLGIEIRVFEDNPVALARLSQLTEKTNQFNIKKVPLREEDIQSAIDSDDSHVFHAQVTDRFGDSGITAFALVHEKDDTWHIESLLMSCRVLGRGVEDAFVSAIAKRAEEGGASELSIAFEETSKNKPAADFIARVMNDKRTSVSSIKAPAWVTVVYEKI
jgi:FkbH-like protein